MVNFHYTPSSYSYPLVENEVSCGTAALLSSACTHQFSVLGAPGQWPQSGEECTMSILKGLMKTLGKGEEDEWQQPNRQKRGGK